MSSASSSPSRGQTSTPTPRSVAAASAKVVCAPSALTGPIGDNEDDDGGERKPLPSAQLAMDKFPSSPVPSPLAHSQAGQITNDSHQSLHSSLHLHDSLQVHQGLVQGPSPAFSALRLKSSSYHQAESHGSQSHCREEKQQPGTTTKPVPASRKTFQDQKPLNTVSIQSSTSSASPSTPTSPLVHTLHAKPFTPSKPPNLAAQPFIPSSPTTTPAASLNASLLTNAANSFALMSVPRQQSYWSPTKSPSPANAKTAMVTTATQYPSPDPSPRTNTITTPSIQPTAPSTPTPIRTRKPSAGCNSVAGLTPPRSPMAAEGRLPQVNGQLQKSSWAQAQGETRDVLGQLAHQLSSLDVKVGAGETREEHEVSRLARATATAAVYADQQPAWDMPPKEECMTSMPAPPPPSYHHPAPLTTADRPVKGEPDACLFVASLNAQRTDEQLTDSVTKHFAKWGDLLAVKVMKDWMNRPYAFVQYRLVSDAQRAIEESHDTVVDGRHVRVEAARVNRTLFLSKLPKAMSDDVLHQFMSKWGKVEDVTLVMNQLTGRTKGSAFAKFRYREDAIRAYLHIRQQGKWAVEWAANLDKTKPETDRLSIFVGQLNPDQATEATVKARFAKYGAIENVHLIAADGEAFAFIKYDDEMGSQLAVHNENGKEFQGSRILVQYRESPETKSPMVRRPLGREPKPLTRPQSNKPSAAASSSTGFFASRPPTGYDRTISFDDSIENLDWTDDQAQLQQQQQQQRDVGHGPRSFHAKPGYSSAVNPKWSTGGSSASKYHLHQPYETKMRHHQHQQHGYPPNSLPPHMYGGYFSLQGCYPPTYMLHNSHQYAGYNPPSSHHYSHAYHEYPPSVPYGAPPPHTHHQHLYGTRQGTSGSVQYPQPHGYAEAHKDAYCAVEQQQIADTEAIYGATGHGNAEGGGVSSTSGGGLGAAMYDSFYRGVGHPPVDPFASTVDRSCHVTSSSPVPLRIPTVPYPTMQGQRHASQGSSSPVQTASDPMLHSPFITAQGVSAAGPKSLFSTLTASAAAGRAEHLESMYTQSLKSALAGLSSADVANTPLASVVAMSSLPPRAHAEPSLFPASLSANVASADGSSGGGAVAGATSASGTHSATPGVFATGFGNAFGSALFPPLGPEAIEVVGVRAESASTTKDVAEARLAESGSTTCAPW